MSEAPQQIPKPRVIHPQAAHTHTIIFLHGRGSAGHEFADDLFESRVDSVSEPSTEITLPERFPNCKWVFPTARSRFSTTFEEESLAWFDIVSLTDPSRREELQVEGLSESVLAIVTLIKEESAFVKPSNIILGGISQGYATAAHVLMALNAQIAGFVGISGWMPFARQIKEAGRDKPGPQMPRAATDFVRTNLGLGDMSLVEIAAQGGWERTPLFLGHELYDEVVSCDLGKEAKDTLALGGANDVWHTYNSGIHWLKEPEEVEDMVKFIDKCLVQCD
jgi:predicted esterase